MDIVSCRTLSLGAGVLIVDCERCKQPIQMRSPACVLFFHLHCVRSIGRCRWRSVVSQLFTRNVQRVCRRLIGSGNRANVRKSRFSLSVGFQRYDRMLYSVYKFMSTTLQTMWENVLSEVIERSVWFFHRYYCWCEDLKYQKDFIIVIYIVILKAFHLQYNNSLWNPSRIFFRFEKRSILKSVIFFGDAVII